MSHYSEPDRHIIDKVKVVLELPNYATTKKLKHTADLDTSYLAAKKILFLWNPKLIN